MEITKQKNVNNFCADTEGIYASVVFACHVIDAVVGDPISLYVDLADRGRFSVHLVHENAFAHVVVSDDPFFGSRGYYASSVIFNPIKIEK